MIVIRTVQAGQGSHNDCHIIADSQQCWQLYKCQPCVSASLIFPSQSINSTAHHHRPPPSPTTIVHHHRPPPLPTTIAHHHPPPSPTTITHHHRPPPSPTIANSQPNAQELQTGSLQLLEISS
ncbi:hypothetical protein FHG87_024098 [Trinorchestia longiramus]|nr:hypothetical protein FHG87_024098 [Trinorchestia longiramus]